MNDQNSSSRRAKLNRERSRRYRVRLKAYEDALARNVSTINAQVQILELMRLEKQNHYNGSLETALMAFAKGCLSFFQSIGFNANTDLERLISLNESTTKIQKDLFAKVISPDATCQSSCSGDPYTIGTFEACCAYFAVMEFNILEQRMEVWWLEDRPVVVARVLIKHQTQDDELRKALYRNQIDENVIEWKINHRIRYEGFISLWFTEIAKLSHVDIDIDIFGGLLQAGYSVQVATRILNAVVSAMAPPNCVMESSDQASRDEHMQTQERSQMGRSDKMSLAFILDE